MYRNSPIGLFFVFRSIMKTVDEKKLTRLFADLPIGTVRYFDRLPSTSTTAMEWIVQHPAEYSLVVADHQTAGYGRNQRSWHSTAGASLSFSLILYPTLQELQTLPLFSALAAVAVCVALESCSSTIKAQIKWPNDVLLDGKKCAGILCESRWQGENLAGLVIGIGVNVSAASIPPASSLLFPATSLDDALGISMDRWGFLHAILEQLFLYRTSFPSGAFMKDWQARLAFMGQSVTISLNSGQNHQGIMQGVDEQGHLVLKEKTGQLLHFSLGDVSLRPA